MVNVAQDESIATLWQRYTGSRELAVRDELVIHYLPLAKSMAARLYRQRHDDTCPFDDYLQYARLGLLEAVERFDPGLSNSFEAYSLYRIRGAVLNGVARESDAAAQRYRFKHRMEFLDNPAVHRPQQASLDDFVDLTVALALGVMLEREDKLEVADKSLAANPYAVTEMRQMKLRVRSLVRLLPEREQIIVTGHYYEQMELQALAQKLKLTKGRVSQLHTRALRRICDLLDQPLGIDRRW